MLAAAVKKSSLHFDTAGLHVFHLVGIGTALDRKTLRVGEVETVCLVGNGSESV